MYPVSAAYKTAIQQNVRDVKIAGTITLKDNTIINITDEDIALGSLYLTEQCVAGEDIEVGNVYASELGFTLKSPPENPYSLDGARVLINFGINVGSNFEYVPLGYFYVTEIERKHTAASLKALDGMILFDTDLTGVLTGGKPRTIISSCCSKVGITLATDTAAFSTFANADVDFALPAESKVKTCRDLIMWVCQALGCFARMNREGQLEIVPIGAGTSVKTISKAQRFSSDVSDFTVKITKVVMTVGETEYSQGTDGMTMALEENPLLTGKQGAEINTILGNILTQVTQAEYTPYNVSFAGDPAIQAGDWIALPDTGVLGGGDVVSLVTHSTWRYRGPHNIRAAGKGALLRGVTQTQQTKAVSSIVAIARAAQVLAQAANQSTQLIKDAIGGHVLIRREPGGTNEILIMDHPDPEQAVKIWRWNMGGLGYSDNVTGADNPDREYTVAMTMDGAINADFVRTGEINTNLVKILGNSNFYWDGDYLYIVNPENGNQQIRLSKEGIRFTRDGGQTWLVAMDFDGIRMEGKSEDGYTHYTGDGVKVYDEVSDLVGHLGKFDTGQSQTVLTEDTQADFNTGTLTDVVATAAGNLELAKDGTDVSVTETAQADFATGTLTNVVATSAGDLELQTVAGPTFSRSSIAYTSTGAQVAANVPRFEQGKFDKAVLVEEGTTNVFGNSGRLDTDSNGDGLADNVVTYILISSYSMVTDSWLGTKSQRAVSSGSGAPRLQYNIAQAVSTGQVWSVSIHGKAQAGKTLYLVVKDQTDSLFAGSAKMQPATGGWDLITLTFTIPSGVTSIKVQFGLSNAVAGDWFQYCALQLEQKPFATSFTPGTRSPETLTIPTAGVLNPQEGTVMLRAYKPAYLNYNARLLWATEGTNRFGIHDSPDGKLTFALNSTDTQFSLEEPGLLAEKEWTWIAMSWKNGLVKAYVNGVLKKQQDYGSDQEAYIGDKLGIGCQPTGGQVFNGLIDELHISNRARTDEEILAAYQSGQPLPVDEYTTYKVPFDGNLKASKAGLRLSPIYNISSIDTVASSAISWNTTLPTNTSMAIETNLSLDGGQTWQGWQVCTNGGAIPGITSETDLSNARLQLRQTLATNDTTITPQLHDVTINLNPPYKTAGYRESPAFGISGECRITWEATLNGQILAIQSNISRDGGTTWEGWQDCVNGGIIPGTDTGNLSNAKLKLKEILTTTDISKTPQLHKVVVSQPIYGYGLWSKNGYFVLNAPPVDGGIRVYDASGNLRTHIGQYAKGKYGAKVINGEIYSTLFQTGEEGASDYIKLSSGNEPLLVVNNNKDALSIWATERGGFIQFFDPYVDDMRGQILPHDDVDGVGLRVQARSQSSVNYALSLQGMAGIEMHGNVWVNNDFRVFGAKDAVVPTENYGLRALSVLEMPESKFMDEGIGELAGGACRIDIDPIFLETIEPNTPETPFIIHLTPYDWLTLRVKEIGDTYFIVEEKDGLSGKFSWQLTATRKGYAGRRLDRIDDEDVLTSNWEDDLLEYTEQES